MPSPSLPGQIPSPSQCPPTESLPRSRTPLPRPAFPLPAAVPSRRPFVVVAVCLFCPQRDVSAHLLAVELNLFCCRVGMGACLGRRRSEPCHVQHAPTVGHDLLALRGGPCVEDLDV